MDPFVNEVKIGPWIREKVMGKGAFGSVTLWKNNETNEQLCLKKCHDMELSDHHREQWQKECDIMLKLNHPNVVRGLRTPPELDPGQQEIPLLAMEYCQGGDLRKVLNKPENCCGLPELQVRAITNDTSLAVEYLHSNKIVHRDIKPENVVLKPLGRDKFQYKLIDLGYAKDVSAGSICKSFVGTEQYLAPELFISASLPGQSYNNNVDYWCLGTTVFECIVGFRPFFHGVPAVRWLQYVQRKRPEQICGIFNLENDIVFSEQIPSPHYLCRYSTHLFEQWLRLMLLYDAKHRGGGNRNNRPVCFEILQVVISTKILHIYHVLDNRILSHPVQSQTLSDIHEQIRRESKQQLPDQFFLTVNGNVLSETTPAASCCGPEDEESLLFLIPKSPYNFLYNRRTEPELVKYILHQKSTEINMPFEILKRGYSHFVYFIKESNSDYHRLTQAQESLREHLLEMKKELIKEKETMYKALIVVQSDIIFFSQSIKTDIENYLKTASYGNKLHELWEKTKERVNSYEQMPAEVSKLMNLCLHLEERVDNIPRPLKGRNENFCKSGQEEILNIYEKIRKTSKADRQKPEHDNSEIIESTKRYLMKRDEHMREIYVHIKQMLFCKQKIAEVMPHLCDMQKRLLGAQEKIFAFQKQRQQDIWGLLNQMCLQTKAVNTADVDVQSRDDNTVFAVPAVPQLKMLMNQSEQASMSAGQNDSSSIMERSTSMSMSLKNESLATIERVSKVVSAVEESLKHSYVIPNWNYLDQDESMQE